MANPEDPNLAFVPDRTLIGAAVAISPAAVGCAVGLLLGAKLSKRNRQSVAMALFTLGAAAAVPAAVDCVRRLISGPASRAGTQRTLREIRNTDGVPFEDPNVAHLEDYAEKFRRSH